MIKIKRIINIIFIICFFTILSFPLLFLDRSKQKISSDENRFLTEKPKLIENNRYNINYTTEYESWFMDHMGGREVFINLNAWIQYKIFDRLLDASDYYLGRNNDLNYATYEMLIDYAHLNLRKKTKYN